jgi:hypothetical protein
MADDTRTQLDGLLKLLQSAPAEFKSEVREAIGAGGVISRESPQQNNADAKRIAFSVGEILHPEGFTPRPSQSLVDALGVHEATRRVGDSYSRNQRIQGATTSITGRDAERLQRTAEMQMSPEEAAELSVE